MTTEPLHPDHLRPGHMVGSWLVVDRLGLGGSARVFEVERDGVRYSMKMALRPLSTGEEAEKEDEPGKDTAGNWRMTREVATLLTYSPHPNLLRVHALDCWPHPQKGYPFFVTDLVEGDDWHSWRWRTNPDAAGLVDTFSAVVRTVATLHERGVYHRDLKAENLLIRREDGWPFLIDFGNVRLPGTFVLTMGVPYGALHLLPPELMEYTRSDAWKQGVPFQGGVAADLYALGVLLYQGLTNKHPFNPKLPDQELVTAISTVKPVAPHLLNPRVPRSLSDITLKLLEKRPEDRYPDTQALLQALWKTTGERKSSAWKVPLLPPGEIPPAEATPEQKEESMTREPGAVPPPGEPSSPADTQSSQETGEEAPPRTHGTRRVTWPFALVAGLALLGVLWWGVRSGHAPIEPPPEAESPASASHPKGSQPVPVSISREPTPSTPDTPRSSLLGALLCVVTGLGCPAVQVKPQPPAYGELCPKEAQRFMFHELKIVYGDFDVTLDIHQPGTGGSREPPGVYREGPLLGRVEKGSWGPNDPPQELPVGTLLYGYLWEGHREVETGEMGVIAIYNKALLPDGREGPVCLWVGNPGNPWSQIDNSRPGAVLLGRRAPAIAVTRWR